MPAMTDDQRDAFLLERRLGTLAVARPGKGPLLAPIWYAYVPGGTIDILTSASTAKVPLLKREGRASMSVIDEGRPYRYVTVEGPITVTELGEGAQAAVRDMAARYFGDKAGARYAESFTSPDEVVIRLQPQRWHAEVLG